MGEGQHGGLLALADVVAKNDETYSVPDRRRGRGFTHDYDGRLLVSLELLGEQEGTFKEATAIDAVGDKMLILDECCAGCFEFTPTDYARMILAAIRLHSIGEYQRSAEQWAEVLKLNANYDWRIRGSAGRRCNKSCTPKPWRTSGWETIERVTQRLTRTYRKEQVDKRFGRFMAVFMPVCIAVVWLTSDETLERVLRAALQTLRRYSVTDALIFSFSVSPDRSTASGVSHGRKGTCPHSSSLPWWAGHMPSCAGTRASFSTPQISAE